MSNFDLNDCKLLIPTVVVNENKAEQSTADAKMNSWTSNSNFNANGDANARKSARRSTQYFKENKVTKQYLRVNRNEFLSESESISSNSESFHCIHGPEGKQYTPKGLLKRNLIKRLDPIPRESIRDKECPTAFDMCDLANNLEFQSRDPVACKLPRYEDSLRDFVTSTTNGYKIQILPNVAVILDYLADHSKEGNLKKYLSGLVRNIHKPIVLEAVSDITKHFNNLQNYFGFLGYLLLTLQDDDDFDALSEAIIWHLTAADKSRGPDAVHRCYVLAAAAPVLIQTLARMIAFSTSHRYPMFVEIALLIACDSKENCIYFIEENIIENILYRFNPYYPDRPLPSYDIGPLNTEDYRVKLGDSTVNGPIVLSLLLVLLKNAKEYLKVNPEVQFPLPDEYSLRCFAWAFRYECKAREHRHERVTMTVIASTLLHCYGRRLYALPRLMMADVMSLSVFTEIPVRPGWLKKISFNTQPSDVNFKKTLILLSVDFLKTFPYNDFMTETQYWLLGLIYLLDPALSSLRVKWSPALFADLRLVALQALVCVLPIAPKRLIKEYSFIRRLMWYVEWYLNNPYQLPILYWTLRVLKSALRIRKSQERDTAMRDLFNTHGIIVIAHLCHTLLDQRVTPVEKSQAILSVSLRLLTSAADIKSKLACSVYPQYKWPDCVDTLAMKMLNVVVFSMERSYVITDRWIISLLNFIWEAIVWHDERREKFISSNGIYKLLDLIVMSRDAVQCMALAVLCDLTKTGAAVAQLITWRTKLQANSSLVKRSSTICSLLASIFREECRVIGVPLHENGVIQDPEFPLMSARIREAINRKYPRELFSHRTSVCYACSDIAGARMPKIYAILYLLSEDLEFKVSIADEAYKLYKNIEISCEDEVMLVLSIHYLTAKLQEVWSESKFIIDELEEEDVNSLDEFLQLRKGWALEIKKHQEEVIKRHNKKEKDKEASLLSFLNRTRLNIALDALLEVRCIARTADRSTLTHALLHDAVLAHHRRSIASKKLETTILKTYKPRLDDQNIIGQNVKIYNNKCQSEDISRNDAPLDTI